MDSSQCYKLLGVSKDASIREIKDAYRRLALEHHPDKNISAKDGVKFKMISEAYHTLRAKNSAYVIMTNHATKYHTINKNCQYEKDSFLSWLNFLYYKIDYTYVKYVRIIFFYYLRYEPILFKYSDKIERKASIFIHHSIRFFRHECTITIFRITSISSKSIHILLTTKGFNLSTMMLSFKNHLKTKERSVKTCDGLRIS